MARGKYAHVLDQLQPAPPADSARQQEIDAAKAAFEGLAAPDLAKQYALLRTQHEIKKLEASVIYLKIEAVEQLLQRSQEHGEPGWGQYGVKDNALRLPDGSTVRVDQEPQARVMDKEAFRLWCIANGYERQLQLWPSTMNSVTKERLLAGDAQPDGVEVNVYKKVVYTAAKAPKATSADDVEVF